MSSCTRESIYTKVSILVPDLDLTEGRANNPNSSATGAYNFARIQTSRGLCKDPGAGGA